MVDLIASGDEEANLHYIFMFCPSNIKTDKQFIILNFTEDGSEIFLTQSPTSLLQNLLLVQSQGLPIFCDRLWVFYQSRDRGKRAIF